MKRGGLPGVVPARIREQIDGARLKVIRRRDDAAPTVWSVARPDSSRLVLKVDCDLSAEVAGLRWLAGRLPVPEVVAYEESSQADWLLTRRIQGRNSYDRRTGLAAHETIDLLASSLRLVHRVGTEGCPFDQSTDAMLARAESQLAAGLRWECWLGERCGMVPADDLLRELKATWPSPSGTTLIHGDYCLPNVLIHRRRLAAIVDVGDLGVGDPWFDFAAVDMSGQRNLGAEWDLQRFLDAYGTTPDPARIEWFSRLYRLAFDAPGKS